MDDSDDVFDDVSVGKSGQYFVPLVDGDLKSPNSIKSPPRKLDFSYYLYEFVDLSLFIYIV